jgi:ankyrin repeat protein
MYIKMSSEEDATVLEAAILFNDEQLLLSLIEAGANVNQIFDNRFTPLITACKYGFINIVNILIENNADVNLDSFIGAPPIYIASSKGFLDIVIKLLDSGAILTDEDVMGFDIVVYASNDSNIDKYNKSTETNEIEKQNIFDHRIKIIREFMMRDLISCKICNKTYSQLNNNELFACTKCVSSIYCSVDCQRQDWTEHKHECTRLIKN